MPSGSLDQRQREPEWMDEPDVDDEQLRRSLAFIRWVNRFLGYTRATLWHLKRFSRSWKPGERISMIDLATGSADIPQAILRWADRRGFDVRIVGVDLHSKTIEVARQENRHARLRIVRADVLNLPFEEGSFDYALCAMFLHHLDDAAALQVLRIMNRLARRGVIASDLLRDPRAYRWIKWFTALSNPMVRHDAAVSVAQAFSEAEVREMARQAGLDFVGYHRHPAYRWVLAGERPAGGTYETAAEFR